MKKRQSGFEKRSRQITLAVCFIVFILSSHRAIWAQQMLYWANQTNGTIQRSNVNGTNVQTIASGLTEPSAIASDPLNAKIYWLTDNGIQSANYDGTDRSTLLTFDPAGDNSGRRGLVIDPAIGKLFWIANPGNIQAQGVRSINLDGTSLQTVYNLPYSTTGIIGVLEGLAVDVPHARLYFTEFGYNQIASTDLNGGNLQIVVNNPHYSSSPFGITVDSTSEKLYWLAGQYVDGNSTTGGIVTSNINGSSIQSLITSSESRLGIAVDPATQKMYWTDSVTGIFSANVDGSSAGPIVFDTNGASGIALVNVPEPNALSILMIVALGACTLARSRPNKKKQ